MLAACSSSESMIFKARWTLWKSSYTSVIVYDVLCQFTSSEILLAAHLRGERVFKKCVGEFRMRLVMKQSFRKNTWAKVRNSRPCTLTHMYDCNCYCNRKFIKRYSTIQRQVLYGCLSSFSRHISYFSHFLSAFLSVCVPSIPVHTSSFLPSILSLFLLSSILIPYPLSASQHIPLPLLPFLLPAPLPPPYFPACIPGSQLTKCRCFFSNCRSFYGIWRHLVLSEYLILWWWRGRMGWRQTLARVGVV